MDKEQAAVERLRLAAEMSEQHYGKPLLVTYSGGKDSDVCLELARRSGIRYEVQHSHTTADAPETVRHVRRQFAQLEAAGVRCTVDYPVYKGRRTSMWGLIVQKGIPPTRLVRYCCTVLKEGAGDGRMVTTGVRWAESRARTGRGVLETAADKREGRLVLANDNDDRRRLLERCQVRAKTVCNPVIDWTEADVWEFLRDAKAEVNPLYGRGFTRVGCIGCPLAGRRQREMEFARYPQYRKMYIHAFGRMLEARQAAGKGSRSWRTGLDVYRWWMGEDPAQIRFWEDEGV